MTVHFTLGQYARHDRNVWTSPCGCRVTDPKHIAELETEYRRCQQTLNGYHGQTIDRSTVKRVIQAVERRGVGRDREPRDKAVKA